MHLSREILYMAVAFFGGGMFGMITGISLLVAWMKGWLFPISIPERLTENSARFAGEGKSLPPAYQFDIDDLGNVTYKSVVPYAGDGEG